MAKGAWRCRVVLFLRVVCSFLIAKHRGYAPVEAWGVGGMGGAGWDPISCDKAQT